VGSVSAAGKVVFWRNTPRGFGVLLVMIFVVPRSTPRSLKFVEMTPMWKRTWSASSSSRKREKLLVSVCRWLAIEPESSTTQRMSTMPSDWRCTSTWMAGMAGGSRTSTRWVTERSTVGGSSSTGDTFGGATTGTASPRPTSPPTLSQPSAPSSATSRPTRSFMAPRMS
jgi:hypothetical protein